MKITPTPPSPVKGEGIMPVFPDVSKVGDVVYFYRFGEGG